MVHSWTLSGAQCFSLRVIGFSWLMSSTEVVARNGCGSDCEEEDRILFVVTVDPIAYTVALGTVFAAAEARRDKQPLSREARMRESVMERSRSRSRTAS